MLVKSNVKRSVSAQRAVASSSASVNRASGIFVASEKAAWFAPGGFFVLMQANGAQCLFHHSAAIRFEISPISSSSDHQFPPDVGAQRPAVAGALDGRCGHVGVFSRDWFVGV
jgi:hypothetical protein